MGVSRTAGTEYAVAPCRSTIEESSALMRASSSATFFPLSDIAGDLTAIIENPRLRHGGRRPSCLPSRSEFEEQQCAGDECQREQRQTRCVCARRILRRAENRRQKESSKSARGADHARDDAHAAAEALRDELEDG